MHRTIAIILDVSNAFKNKKIPIHEIVCVSPPSYHLDWFKISYPYVLLNRYYGIFCPQFINGIQGTKPAGQKWNKLFDVVVTVLRYK